MTVASRTITAKPRLLIVPGIAEHGPNTRYHCENANQHHSPKPRRSARNGLLEMLASAKGPLRIGQEGLAEALGVTSARVRQLLKELAAAGTIRVRTSSTGSLISLIEGGRA
jgi:hypothetical protein